MSCQGKGRPEGYEVGWKAVYDVTYMRRGVCAKGCSTRCATWVLYLP